MYLRSNYFILSFDLVSDGAHGNSVPLQVEKHLKLNYCDIVILAGADSVSEDEAMQTGLIDTLKQSQFDIHKWI